MKKITLHKEASCFFIALTSLSSSTFAASPWLPAPESGSASLSYIYATADELFEGVNKKSLPSNLDQHTILLDVEYGVTDRLALDLSLGYSATHFIEDPNLSPSSSLDGLVDPTFGLRYKVWDELEDGGVTVTLHTGFIIAGGYTTGAINAIGNNAFGVEFSTIVGKIWDNGIGLSTELGYRYREKDVPDQFYTNVDAFYSLQPAFDIPLTASFNYQFSDSLTGIDIGSPGFTPEQFPQTQEDYHIVGGGLSYSLMDNVSASVNYGHVVGGRNTAASHIVSVGFSYGF